MRLLTLAYALAAPAVLWSSTALASNIYVGGCGPGTATKVDTITHALSVIGSPGTIFICPGTYPEQVTINGKNISLRGISDNNSSAAVIVPPPGGLVQNASLNGSPVAAQIAISDAVNITVSNLTVDGTNNNLSSGCDLGLEGILLQNSSGTISNNSVSNQIQPGTLDGCQSGNSIDARNWDAMARQVAIRGNYVSNFQKNGIVVRGAGLTATISGNTSVGRGPTAGIPAANNSIEVAYGAGGTVSNNFVADDVWAPDTSTDTGDAATGILAYDAASVTVTQNAVNDTQYGIAFVNDGGASQAGGSVTKNHVGATHLFDGVDICGANNISIGMNTVYGSTESGIHLDSSCGSATTGSSVVSNTINGGCAGILVGSGSDASGISTNNTLYNAGTQILSGSDVCPIAPPTPAQVRAKSGRRFSVGR